MITTSNVHILITGSSAYDLRKVITWSDNTIAGVEMACVQFEGIPSVVKIPRATFEPAKTASLAAAGG